MKKTGVGMDWFAFSIISLVLWGVWGFLAKILLKTIEWQQLFVVSEIGALAVAIAAFLYLRPAISMNQTFLYAAAAGAMGVLGSFALYLALSTGKASVIVPLTALYPVVTILLSFVVLQEKITLFQGAGVFFALVSMFLISLG